MHFRALCALLGLALSSTPSSTTSVRTTFSCAKGVHAVCADNAFDLNNTNGLYDHVTGAMTALPFPIKSGGPNLSCDNLGKAGAYCCADIPNVSTTQAHHCKKMNPKN